MGRILKTLMGTYSGDILTLEPLLDRLDRIEARLSAVEGRPNLEVVLETVLRRSVEDLRARLNAEIQEYLTKFEGAIDNKVSLRIAKVETALIEQSVLITTLSQRAVDSEINLQRLISAVEKLFERADPAALRKEPSPFELPSDSGFRPRIVKEDDKTPRPRTPLTKL
jgi:hypothetical protein